MVAMLKVLLHVEGAAITLSTHGSCAAGTDKPNSEPLQVPGSIVARAPAPAMLLQLLMNKTATTQ
jgi:hypothetical protein